MLFVCARVLLFVFFFFKQKTAYEMRISDWSSDVCSSDLCAFQRDIIRCEQRLCSGQVLRDREILDIADEAVTFQMLLRGNRCRIRQIGFGGIEAEHVVGRSEEHTSELQSLMRISYAVFCLKKKTTY